MRAKLTDAEVAHVRALVAEGGFSRAQIGERFGISRQHVSRLVSGEQRPLLPATVDALEAPSVAAAVADFVASLRLGAEENVIASTALMLASKLDAARRSEVAQSAMAASGLARELMGLLDQLRQVAADSGPRLGALRGEEAVLVASELGYPDPEGVRVERFDSVELLRLRRARRLFKGGKPNNRKRDV